MSRPRLAPIAVALLVTGCGSYGDPLPPLRAVPPAVPDFEIAQRGHEALVRFSPPAPSVNVEGRQMEIARIELLMLVERYPALTADLLALSLDAARRDRLEAARAATESAIAAAAERQRLEAQRQAEEAAAAAGEPPPTEAPPPETADPEEAEGAAADEATAAPLTEAQLLIRKVPSGALARWREANVEPETVEAAARGLQEAVDELWDALLMPTAIVDLRRPPVMPDPLLVIRRANQIARTRAYETQMPGERFLERATVVADLAMDELPERVVDGRVLFTHPLGAPASGPVRTRYFFAVRTIDSQGREGDVSPILSLAPVAVPLPPQSLTATVTEEGVELRWSPPAADINGAELEDEDLAYNVYRRMAAAPRSPTRAINATPLAATSFQDEAMAWEQRYVYEVRALHMPPRPEADGEEDAGEDESATAASLEDGETDEVAATAGPVKEGAGAATEPVRVFDTFAPGAPRSLESVRAGNRVTLRWQASGADDLAGYRVYRHAAPAPGVDMAELGFDVDPEEGAAGEAPAPQRDEAPRRRGNPLLAAGWEMLSAVVLTDLRYIDPISDPATAWVYAVEAIDRAGNVSESVAVLAAAESGR